MCEKATSSNETPFFMAAISSWRLSDHPAMMALSKTPAKLTVSKQEIAHDPTIRIVSSPHEDLLFFTLPTP
jgi:hypothetical protein